MGRLDCKEASLIALKGLSHDADFFALISEEEGQAGADYAASHGWKVPPPEPLDWPGCWPHKNTATRSTSTVTRM